VVSYSRTLNTNWEKTLSTPIWRRAQNAVCLNGVGHDGDGPNAASSDASNHNFRTLIGGGDGRSGLLEDREQSTAAERAAEGSLAWAEELTAWL